METLFLVGALRRDRAVHLRRLVGGALTGAVAAGLGAILGVAVYNITNGTPTSFRYSMPGIVFFAMAVGALVAQALPQPAGAATLTPPQADQEPD